MARKENPKPIITYAEILCRGIRSLDADIHMWRERCEGLPEQYFKDATQKLRQQREALCALYRIETGNDYE